MSAILKLKVDEITPALVNELKEKYANADVEIRIVSSGNEAPFSKEDFWKMIALLDWNHKQNDDLVIQPVVNFLADQPVSHIYRFEDILSKLLFQLDTQAHAESIGENGYNKDDYFSVDNFLYARACVVANGQTFYEKVLKTPSSMPKDLTFEPILSIASKAYEKKKGQAFDYVQEYNYETYSNASGWT